MEKTEVTPQKGLYMLDTKLQDEISKNFNDDIVNKLNNVIFPVELQPIPTVPQQFGRKVVRTDQASLDGSEVLGLVGSRYKPIPHINAFGGALLSMKNAELDFTDADVQVETYQNGAMAKMEVLFPKHTTKIGDHDLAVKYVARNSYNGAWKFQSFFGWLNFVCFNTLVTGQKLAYSANRHTIKFDIDETNQKIQNAVKAIKDETVNYNNWWQKKVSDEDVVKLFRTTMVGREPTIIEQQTGAKTENTKQLDVLTKLYEQEVTHIHGGGDNGRGNAQGTLWCAFQAATAWSTHLRDALDKGKRNHILQQHRQTAVRKMITSKQWKQLEVA